MLKSFQEAKHSNSVEYSKALYEFEKNYCESELSCFRDQNEEFVNNINDDVISFIESIRQEYDLVLYVKYYEDSRSLS